MPSPVGLRYGAQALLQIPNDIRDVLDPHRKAQQAVADAQFPAGLDWYPTMRRHDGIQHEAMHITKCRGYLDQLQRVQEAEHIRLACPRELEGHHATPVGPEKDTVGSMTAGIVDGRDAGLRREPFGYLSRIFAMTQRGRVSRLADCSDHGAPRHDLRFLPRRRL